MRTFKNRSENKTTRRTGSSSGGVLLVIAIVVGLFMLGKDEKLQRTIKSAISEAKPVVLNKECTDDAGIINGELDYGVTVSVTVKNTGEAGMIGVTPVVSCSEGEWSRTQNLQFAADEVKALTFFFHEPTLNASNVRYTVRLSP